MKGAEMLDFSRAWLQNGCRKCVAGLLPRCSKESCDQKFCDQNFVKKPYCISEKMVQVHFLGQVWKCRRSFFCGISRLNVFRFGE